MTKFFKIVFLLCLFTLNSFSQEIFTRQLAINRENPDTKYNTIYFDANGLMWIGTSEGLYQYDGNDFILFSLTGKNSVNDVTAIMQDTNKIIWTGYRNGKIAKLISDSLVLFNPSEGVPVKPVTSILQDKKGIVWISTAGEGIYFLNNKRLYNINEDDGLNNNHVYSMTEDNSGNIWAGADQGISVCQPDTKRKVLRTLTYKDGLPDEIIRVLQKDRAGNILIGTQDKGICKFDMKQNKIVIPSEFQNWKYGQVNDMYISNLEYWIATEDNGIIIYNLINKESSNFSLFGNTRVKKINNVLKDYEGNMWIVSNSSLLISEGNALKSFDRIKNQKISYVHAILSAHDDQLFFTPDQQLAKISEQLPENEIKHFTITSADALIDIVSLHEDTCGYIWIGTMGEGLFRLNSKTGFKQKITGYNSLDKSSVLSIDGIGNEIWLGTLEGAIKCTITGNCNKDNIQYRFTGFEKQKEIGNYFIYKVFVDSRKRTWFGTDGNGLIVSEQNKFTRYDTSNGLKSNVVYSITEDKDGNIWISTDYGIYKFDGSTFINYNLRNGLREIVSTSLLADDNGNIVSVHKRGLDILNITSGIVQYVNLSSSAEEINPDINSITSDSKGNVWIGTEKGILRFNSHFKNFKSRPVSFIKKVSLLADNSVLSNAAKLKHNQNNISVEFTGIWFTTPEDVKYQYKLSGYDKDWISTKDRKIIFPNLHPGNYTFYMKSTACNNFDIASEASFSFTVNKPFWDEAWFRILAILMLGGAAFLFLKRRDRNIRRLHGLEKEKIKFQFETLKSQVNPHFLFNSFNTLISIIEKDKNIAVEYVENLSEYFRNLIYYRDKDVIPLGEELKLSSAYYFLQQKRFGTSLSVVMNIDKNKNQWMVPPLVVQILIENAIKHNAISRETPLTIHINTENEKLCIKNNINPKYSAEKSTGTGIKNIINRYELLTQEKVSVEKTENEFIVSIPLIKI